MGLFTRAITERKAVDPLQVWADMLKAGRSSKAGPTVTLEAALRVAVVLACGRKIAQGRAQVPFKLFQSVEKDGLPSIRPATEHWAYDLAAVRANDWTTSYEFRETQTLHAALAGNAYAFKNRLRNGKIAELILLNPSRVEPVQREDYSIVYKVTGKSGAVQEFPSEAIWHVRGPSWDGLVGMDVMSLAREAIGLTIATEETHSKLHAKGVSPSGTYSVDGVLSAEQYVKLKEWILKEFAGAENSGMPMILDNGAKWISTAQKGVDAQHLETRGFQIQEVCRFLDVMPIMVGHSDKVATYASAEQMFLAHVIHTLGPWYERFEQSANLHLLTQKEREQGYYFKHIAAGLLRGASKDRSDYFAKALGSGGSPGWMTQDEVRALEELNPMGGAAGALPIITNAPKPEPKEPDDGA